jgi:Leucine-rich repeat (LRR) protein
MTIMALFAFVFLNAVCVLLSLSAPNLPSYEISALHDLYNATNGANWRWKPVGSHWVFTPTANPCVGKWQGITCVLPSPGTTYYVSEISLQSFNLMGAIPESVGVYSHLKSLKLRNNHVTGTIPASASNLTQLQDLDLHLNLLSGTIPDALGSLSQLTYLYLASNQLESTIPAALGSLSQLTFLELGYNRLNGTIPDALGSLSQLTVLSLRANQLEGTIPAALGSLSHLTDLDLHSNQLEGTIPAALGSLSQLTDLDLHYNQLEGTIPAALGSLSQLTYLDLDSNQLDGTIPAALGSLSQLTDLDLHYNQLEGTIPAALGSLSQLTFLYLTFNQLTGTIPAALGSLSQLTDLDLFYNQLTGTIPAELASLSHLRYLHLASNQLEGTIPAALGSLSQLTVLDLSSNQLEGTILTALGTLSQLTYLDLASNQLEGTIPAALGSLNQLTFLGLEDSKLDGTIPDSISMLQHVTSLYLQGNRLTGSLPAQIGNMTALQFFYASDNLLHGSLPDSFKQLSALQELQLYNNSLSGPLYGKFSTLSGLNLVLLSTNRFSGPLDDAFNATLQTNMSTIQVNNNQLTGTLPDEVFKLPALLNFVAVSNCFHGTIPLAACSSSALSGLILDGLSSATSCRRALPSGAYLLSRSVGGTLPVCLFQLPALTTLHLSGNKFTGSVPSTLALSNILYDVSLSHNSLTGAIPEVIQQRRWYNLDLSYNRLSATLSEDFGAKQSAYSAQLNLTENECAVSLENNRLSGRIPGYLQSLQNVSILGTNLFSCALDGAHLPAQDSDRDNYQCGSSGFDVPYYVWLILTGVGCSGLAWAARSPADVLRRWYDSSQRVVDDRPVLASLMHAMDALCSANLYAGTFVVVVLVPCYVALSHYSGTLTHQYAWAVSAAFLSGVAPVAVELPLWLLLTVLMLAMLRRASLLANYLTRGYRSWSQTSSAASIHSITKAGRFVISMTFLLIDVVVVVGVNVLYVYIAIYQSSALLVLAQVLMSFFKLLWNSVCMDAILRALVGRVAPQLLVGQGYAKAYRVRLMSLQVFTALLNSVVVPCLVVAAVSPNCFYNVFQPAPTVRSVLSYKGCSNLDVFGECYAFAYVRVATSYDAPFTYSYQCSSSLITYYAPAFVNLCIITVFAVPSAQLVSLQLLQRLPLGSNGGYAQGLLRLIVPPILRPLPDQTAERDAAHTVPYVQASRILVSLATSLSVLLTFGAVFPPLGLALTFTAAATVLFTKLTIGRFLCGAEDRGQLATYLAILEQQCDGAGSAGFLRGTAWMLVTLTCLFYTLFLFDTLGDAVGFRGALWVLIVVPLLPAVLYAGVAFAERGSSSGVAEGEARPKEAEVGGATGDVELSVVGTVSPVHSATEKF